MGRLSIIRVKTTCQLTLGPLSVISIDMNVAIISDPVRIHGYKCLNFSTKICVTWDTSQPKSSLFIQKIQNPSGLGSNLGKNTDNPGSCVAVSAWNRTTLVIKLRHCTKLANENQSWYASTTVWHFFPPNYGVLRVYGFRLRISCEPSSTNSKFYGFSQVMGYH